MKEYNEKGIRYTPPVIQAGLPLTNTLVPMMGIPPPPIMPYQPPIPLTMPPYGPLLNTLSTKPAPNPVSPTHPLNPMTMPPTYQSPINQSPPLVLSVLTPEMLRDVKPVERKRLIGERLFPKIQVVEPRLAGKITGMLLEMDNSELLDLLLDQGALIRKINEALAVLKDHQQKSSIPSISTGVSQLSPIVTTSVYPNLVTNMPLLPPIQITSNIGSGIGGLYSPLSTPLGPPLGIPPPIGSLFPGLSKPVSSVLPGLYNPIEPAQAQQALQAQQLQQLQAQQLPGMPLPGMPFPGMNNTNNEIYYY